MKLIPTLLILSLFAFIKCEDVITFDELFNLDPSTYSNKCIDMSSTITILEGAINEIEKYDIKQTYKQMRKIVPKLNKKIKSCKMYLQKIAVKQQKLEEQKNQEKKRKKYEENKKKLQKTLQAEIKFNKEIMQLQIIQNKLTKEILLFSYDSKKQTPFMVSAQFVSVAVADLLQILIETENSVKYMKENELAKNLALLSAKTEEVTQKVEILNKYYENVQTLIDKKDKLAEMMKQQC